MEAQELLDKLNDPTLSSLFRSHPGTEDWPSRLDAARKHLTWITRECDIQLKRIDDRFDARNDLERTKQQIEQQPYQLIADVCRKLDFALLKDDPNTIRANWIDYGRYLWNAAGSVQLLSAEEYVLKKKQQLLDKQQKETFRQASLLELALDGAKADSEKQLKRLEKQIQDKSNSHAAIIEEQQSVLSDLLKQRPEFLTGFGMFTSFVLFPVAVMFIPVVLYLLLVLVSTIENVPGGLMGPFNRPDNWPQFFVVSIIVYMICVVIITVYKIHTYSRLKPQIERATKKLNQLKSDAHEFELKAHLALASKAEIIDRDLQGQLIEIQHRAQLESSQLEQRHRQELLDFESNVLDL